MEPLIAEVWSEEPEFQTEDKETESIDSPVENGENPAQDIEDKTEAETEESMAKDERVEDAAEDAPPASGASVTSHESEAGGSTVTVEDFLNKTDKPECVSDHSPLEPLTPSKVLECAAENPQEEKEDSTPNHETSVEEEPSGPSTLQEPSISE